MRPAVEGLIAAVSRTKIADPVVPVIANASAKPLTMASEVRRELGDQIASPVHWHESVTLMAGGGAGTFVEFGPGRVLTGLVRRLSPEATLVNVSSLKDAVGEVAVGRQE
jgi:[acyl-carrier-protein] S-malonyltransferase